MFEASSKMAKYLGKKGGFMGRQNNQLRYRMKPIQSIKIADERFATPDDKFLMAKARWKQAVIKVLTKLQAYHIYEKIKRNKYCVIPVARFVKGYTKEAVDKNNSLAGPTPNKSMYGSMHDVAAEVPKSGVGALEAMQLTSGESDFLFDEDVDSDDLKPADYGDEEELSGEEENAEGAQLAVDSKATPAGRKETVMSNFKDAQVLKPAEFANEQSESSVVDEDNQDGELKADPDNEEFLNADGKINWQWIFLQERVMGEPQQIPQSVIYELINETINKDAYDISCPEPCTVGGVLLYIFLMPLTHTQYITVPSPLSKVNSDFYPLTLILSSAWIFGYTYVIVWFTYDVSNGLGLPFSILPMLLYPFCVAIRESKKFKDFSLALEVFDKELQDQELSLAETYQPQIFQMTFLSGLAWTLYSATTGKQVRFVNESIQAQLPLLIGVVVFKLLLLSCNKFKTNASLFWSNVTGYIVFLLVVLFIDFRKQLFGGG